jgi:hypothetical protein
VGRGILNFGFWILDWGEARPSTNAKISATQRIVFPLRAAEYRRRGGFDTAAEYRRRGGFDTAKEQWKESISSPAYSTTGLTLPDQACTIQQLVFDHSSADLRY